MGVVERALPLALTIFCGVVGGYYTFQPVFAADAIDNHKRTQPPTTPPPPAKNPAPESK